MQRGVATAAHGHKTVTGNYVPDSVQSNIGKWMLAEQVYHIFQNRT